MEQWHGTAVYQMNSSVPTDAAFRFSGDAMEKTIVETPQMSFVHTQRRLLTADHLHLSTITVTLGKNITQIHTTYTSSYEILLP